MLNYCAICDLKADVPHHLSYVPEVTIPVCTNCHDLIHGTSHINGLYVLDPFQSRYWVYPELPVLQWAAFNCPVKLQKWAVIAVNDRSKYSNFRYKKRTGDIFRRTQYTIPI
jgi:hypothetical protein